MSTIIAMHQHQGDREYQQDAMGMKVFSNGDLGTLCVLADGMGGYKGGEIASKIIIETFREITIDSDNITNILQKALEKANQRIAIHKEQQIDVSKMGSTLVSTFVTKNQFQWISVGDSPLYLVKDGSKLERINENHSVAGLLELQLKEQEITEKEFNENPNKHMLTSAITGESIPLADISTSFEFKDNYILVLASDGIETLSKIEIEKILQQNNCKTQVGLNNTAQQLIDAVLDKEKPKQDNISVILISKERRSTENLNSISTIKLHDNEDGEIFTTSIVQKKNNKINLKWLFFGSFLIAFSGLLWLIYDIYIDDKSSLYTKNNHKVHIQEKNTTPVVKIKTTKKIEKISIKKVVKNTSIQSNKRKIIKKKIEKQKIDKKEPKVEKVKIKEESTTSKSSIFDKITKFFTNSVNNNKNASKNNVRSSKKDK